MTKSASERDYGAANSRYIEALTQANVAYERAKESHRMLVQNDSPANRKADDEYWQELAAANLELRRAIQERDEALQKKDES